MNAKPEGTVQEIELAPGKILRLETGLLAKQAGGSVVAQLGDTMVLCTAVISPGAREGQDFFPLTVDYREKYAAGGKIPGGFIKREGRPTDKEVLSSRLIDRAIRPLFADGFYHEVQVIATVISAGEYNADAIAGVGASAALVLAGAPFSGPMSEVRIARVNGEWVVNPLLTEMDDSDVDLMVGGTERSIVMVEGEMDEISEEEMVEAFELAHEVIIKLCRAQNELARERGNIKPFEYTPILPPEKLVDRVRQLVGDKLAAHVRQPYDKQTFYAGIDELKNEVVSAFLGANNPETGETRADVSPEGYTPKQISEAFSSVESQAMREMILSDGRRIDGRGLTDIRPIWMEVSYLPRVHGSSVFTRGETQVLASVTLGTGRSAQEIDQIFENTEKHFYLHYSFPPFSTGEVKFLRGAGRREIGHGFLAERSLAKVMPDFDSFPYTVRVTGEVLESNGSSSMATVCSGSLALMDAGVPIRKHVAGMAMGLIAEGNRTAVLSDILGTEDHLGDMDFKVTGTRDGITACQMDIKVTSLPREVLLKALKQAKDGREHILGLMESALPEPRPDLSPYAPRLTQITIDAEFIGAVIGPGGRIIQGIQRETDTTIEIEEKEGKGFVRIAATNAENSNAAIERIRQIVAVPEVGEEYEGTVRNIQPFGAIVEIMPGKEGLVHVSELDYGYVDKVEDYVQVGDKMRVQLIEVRDDGKLRLSRKALLPKPEGYQEQGNGRPPRGDGDRDRNRGGGERRGGRPHGGGGRGGRSGGGERR
ncbi:MAG TPA: polyribonucleotide nucleotidyltransferase [Rhodothermales bacterium]|nr:polyribonucleotide nucleotidyltransferase [Rhodothermales bacterium]